MSGISFKSVPFIFALRIKNKINERVWWNICRFFFSFFILSNLNLPFYPQYVEYLSNLRHIEINTPGCAQFEFEMDLRDPNAKILLYKVRQYSKFIDISILHLDR